MSGLPFFIIHEAVGRCRVNSSFRDRVGGLSCRHFLETGQVAIEVGGRTFSKVPDVASLKGILGDCTLVEGIVGGTFYSCANGLAVGVDVEGRVTQLRVRRR